MARVARLRGARLTKRAGVLIPRDAGSVAIVAQALRDVAEWTKRPDYQHATPEQRRAALEDARG